MGYLEDADLSHIETTLGPRRKAELKHISNTIFWTGCGTIGIVLYCYWEENWHIEVRKLFFSFYSSWLYTYFGFLQVPICI